MCSQEPWLHHPGGAKGSSDRRQVGVLSALGRADKADLSQPRSRAPGVREIAAESRGPQPSAQSGWSTRLGSARIRASASPVSPTRARQRNRRSDGGGRTAPDRAGADLGSEGRPTQRGEGQTRSRWGNTYVDLFLANTVAGGIAMSSPAPRGTNGPGSGRRRRAARACRSSPGPWGARGTRGQCLPPHVDPASPGT